MTEPNVDDLFRWYKSVTIGDRQIWLRTLSATDDTERTKAAMRASRKMRASLLEEGSPERDELLGVYGGVERKEALAAIRVFRTEEARALVAREVQPEKDPPEPAGPTLDDAMDAEEVWEKEIVDLARRREAWIKEHVKVIMDRHADEDDEKLRETAFDLQVSAFCTQAYLEEFERQSVFRACYVDEEFTGRTFSSADGAGSIGSRAFEKLLREYYSLDRFALNADYLKN